MQKNADAVIAAALHEADDVLAAARKQAQVVLMTAQQTRSDQRLRLVVEAAPHGIIMVDQSGKIALVNSQFESLFGYGREELLGRPIELLAPSSSQSKDNSIGGKHPAESRSTHTPED